MLTWKVFFLFACVCLLFLVVFIIKDNKRYYEQMQSEIIHIEPTTHKTDGVIHLGISPRKREAFLVELSNKTRWIISDQPTIGDRIDPKKVLQKIR